MNKIDEIKTAIKDYLKRISNVIFKVVQLSNGFLVIKDGRVFFKEDLAPFEFDATNVEDMTIEQFKRIDYCLEFMSKNGISPRYLAEVGKSLNTLYAIFDSNLDLGEIENSNFQPKKKKDELFQLQLFNFNDVTMPESYDEDVCIPICYSEKEDEGLCWHLSKGILTINAEYETESNINSFIRSLIVQFLYSFPNASAQLLYCCSSIDDATNFFLTQMKNNIGEEFFFERVKYFGSNADRYSSEIVEVLSRLHKLCSEDRTLLLSDSAMSSILKYNSQNPNNAQNPILVVLRNYPSAYENYANLEYLFNYGKKYGVYFVAVNDGKNTRNKYSDDIMIEANDYSSLVVTLENGELICDDEVYSPLKIKDDKMFELFEPLKQLKAKSRGTVTYDDVGFGKEKLEREEVTNEISIPVGKVDDRVFTMDFAVASKDSKPVAYMIIGKPGCGKSSIIDSLIINGSMKYSPDDLTFYLIDFKDGVSSAPYIGNAKMPHIKLVAQKSKQEEAEIILKTVLKEKTRRNNIFIKNDCQNLVEYNKKADERGEKHLPRIIVAIDEFHAIFKDDGDADRSQRLSDYCKQIVKEARSAGIHLVIASQNADRKLMTCVGDFISGRFCFEVVNIEHAEAVFNRQNALKVKSECTGHTGVAMVSYDSGETAKKIRASFHSGKQNDYAESVRKRWSEYEIDTAVVGDDSVLNFSNVENRNDLYDDLSEGAPIGLSYYDHKVVTLPFSKVNPTLMVTGGSDAIQTDHLMSVMIYAMKCRAKIMLLDESDSLMISKTFEGYDNVEQYAGKDYLEMLSKANAELKKRIENRRQTFDPYFVVIHSLHMIRDFTDDRKGGGKKTTPDGYMSLRAMREATSEDNTVEGLTTFMQMLKDASLVNNFYICFSIKPDMFPRRGSSVNDVKLKVLHHQFDQAMENIVERMYNHKKVGMTCPSSISLFSESNQPFEKVRYYHYDEDERTIKLIKEVLDNEN